MQNNEYKIDVFIKIYDRSRYLTLYGFGNYDATYNKIRDLIGVKSCVTYVFSCYYANSKLIRMLLCL